ncbi:hypothetical protein VD0002_g8055 [Verticillium dahliae]|uniref:Cellulose-binding family II n=2 Tax=Verticillium dahliae TaxID=27337 RepID=G2XJ61_VERDV|nr:cellulose-binding family II [Verticillium dahliae VdLs.17]KAF3351433.1 Putative exosome complex exonuclease 1 [Verticillium dahliae VDG2]KAH6661600.1 cellulose-binding family II [Verticillium dahliae]EGY20564.1 cellulose-binding family II [Verticillium dahliae VdLs.17]PNH26718.1 hypothetical protein BJF96_g9999 [Verticillium dahliae]PNH49028.1 hypothetical protein VD0003_g8097 [Verticillium dahliae]
MHYSLLSTAALAFAASVSGYDISTPSDQDGSVWQALAGKDATSFAPRSSSNRPAKRQAGWNPPTSLATPLKQVWDHCLATYGDGDLFRFKNYGWDQLIAAQGTINMCVRWESDTVVTEAQRSQIAKVTAAQYQKWFQWLYGYDNFPYTNVKVNIVGWAVRDKALLQGSTAGLDIYTNKDGSGIPECAPACGRFFNQNGDYSRCPGGAARHYDQSLWLTDGMGGGAGGDWGQRIGREYFMGALNSENVHILLHEMGHTYGLDDFYDWTPTGINNFVMLAGSSQAITEFDGWMLRNWWYELSRKRGWQSGSGGSAPPPAAVTAAPTTTRPAATTTRPATTTTVRPATTTARPTSTPPATGSGPEVPRWGQCGGSGYTGPTRCVAGSTCTVSNQYYSQCL